MKIKSSLSCPAYMQWTKKHVFSSLHICWAAQAGLYFHYGIPKYELNEKLSGVYKHKILNNTSPLLRGFDDYFYAPHSRYTSIDKEKILACDKLELLTYSETAGCHIIASRDGKHIFITGHSEYDANTLHLEYIRDKNAGINTKLPLNYYPNDDDRNIPIVSWRAHANLLFQNWLNYYVYQSTPYDIKKVGL